MVDLTHAIDISVRPPDFKNSSSGTRPASVASSAHNRNVPEQFATEIDAPAQLARSLWTVDQIPAERLIASLVVIDVRQEAENNQDYQISVHDIARWEREHGQMPLGSGGDGTYGMGTRAGIRRKSIATLTARVYSTFPDIRKMPRSFWWKDATCLVWESIPRAWTAVSHGDLAVQRYTLAHSVYPLENVANLDRAPETNGVVIVAPVKMAGSSRGPVRIMALVR